MSYVISFVLAALLTGGWLWGVARWSGFVIPTTDLLIIVGLCNALALLPGWGWVLAMLDPVAAGHADDGRRPVAGRRPHRDRLGRRLAPRVHGPRDVRRLTAAPVDGGGPEDDGGPVDGGAHQPPVALTPRTAALARRPTPLSRVP